MKGLAMRFPFRMGQNAALARLKWLQQRPEILWFGFSALCLSAFAIGSDPLVLAALLATSGIGFLLLRRTNADDSKRSPSDSLTGLRPPDVISEIGEKWLAAGAETQRKFACFVVTIDNFAEFKAKYGDTAAQQAQRTVASRILRGLREDDMLTRTGDGEFLFILTPVRHLDLEICIQLASRMKAAIEMALPIDATTVRVTASIGFCRSDQVEAEKFAALSQAATLAMEDARRSGASIRAYAPDLDEKEKSRNKLSSEASRALKLDQIIAWYQPQISNETGAITGFEALARWEHPERGILSPFEFMDTLTETGQLEDLADVMLKQALQAQMTWEKSGFAVPHVGVNFAGEELRNPMLVEKIHWELDRFDLAPNRIAIEVLETVIADAANGAIARNVNGLANLGCYIDLDDFGTGHASISSIRRFAVSRLKIDRSFVMKVDKDPEQQKLVAAIVTMAERLGMETLAEGVETAGEHAMLAQLGCGHVQGYGIARPMPFDQTIPWMREHAASQAAPQVLRIQ